MKKRKQKRDRGNSRAKAKERTLQRRKARRGKQALLDISLRVAD